MRETPNFRGWTATILHRSDATTERLDRQLRLLGMMVSQSFEPLALSALPDLVLVDADQGYGELVPWAANDLPPCPVVALLGSEAPSRIAWALEHGSTAILAKPLSASAVFPALVAAVHLHRERKAAREQARHLEERIRLRPLVHAAITRLMNVRGLDEETAYDVLRSSAMRRRLPMEQVAALIVGGAEPLPEVG